jgi:hypothetical protein
MHVLTAQAVGVTDEEEVVDVIGEGRGPKLVAQRLETIRTPAQRVQLRGDNENVDYRLGWQARHARRANVLDPDIRRENDS